LRHPQVFSSDGCLLARSRTACNAASPAAACPTRPGSASARTCRNGSTRLIGEERIVVAFPDCFTRLGGNQYINYINSASMGAWEDFLLHEMLTTVEQRFGCVAAPGGTPCSARVLADMARSPTLCATPTSGSAAGAEN